MEKIISVNPKDIHPSQNFLKKDTFDFIKKNYEKGDLDKLPPTPIVKKFGNNEYVAIDGHNLLAFYASKGIDCDVYVAESKDDKISGSSDMIAKRNKELFERYDGVLESSKNLEKEGIFSVVELLDRIQ